jgi:hypothetical protein
MDDAPGSTLIPEIQIMTDLALAQTAPAILSGAAALLCLVLSPVFRSRRTILLVQVAALLSFTLHYFCLGIEIAVLANFLGALQVGAALFAAGSQHMRRLAYTLIALMVLLSLWLWEGPLSALGVIAMILTATARMQTDVFRLRALFVVGISVWALHDFVATAWIAFAADVGSALVGAVALLPMLLDLAAKRRSHRVRAITFVTPSRSRA